MGFSSFGSTLVICVRSKVAVAERSDVQVPSNFVDRNLAVNTTTSLVRFERHPSPSFHIRSRRPSLCISNDLLWIHGESISVLPLPSFIRHSTIAVQSEFTDWLQLEVIANMQGATGSIDYIDRQESTIHGHRHVQSNRQLAVGATVHQELL
jgi:hypothetical protein